MEGDVYMSNIPALINRAQKYIDDANVLLSNENTPFNTMYRYLKSMRSMWIRLVEESVDVSNSRLEEKCMDLELTIEKVQEWINTNSPLTQQENTATEAEAPAESKDENQA